MEKRRAEMYTELGQTLMDSRYDQRNPEYLREVDAMRARLLAYEKDHGLVSHT